MLHRRLRSEFYDDSCSHSRDSPSPSIQIPAIGPGVLSAVNGDPYQGVVLSYAGSSPTLNDPWSCPTNPATGDVYPRQTEFVFTCDTSVAGYAILDSVEQNTTDSCDYTLHFRTNVVCFVGGRSSSGAIILPISGGWIFMSTLLVAFGVYALGGIAWGFARTRRLAFPNPDFWIELQDLIFEGAVFAFSCGRKRMVRGGGFKPNTSGAGVAVAAPAGSGFQSARNGSGIAYADL